MKKLIEKIKKDEISEVSAISAYYIILSIIPFCLIFISLIQYINLDKEILISYISQAMPEVFKDLALNIIEEIYSKTIVSLSFSIIFTIWSASKGCTAIIKGIENIYEIKESSFIEHKIKSVLFTIFILLLLVILLLILTFGKSILEIIKINLQNNNINNIIKMSNYIFPISIFIIFQILYKYIAKNKFKMRKQILGSSFVTISWYVLSYIFSLYIEINKGFSILYGSLSTIILFMLWIYFLIYAILLGAEINIIKDKS